MNVNINYVVSLDKLPTEVKKLFVEARQSLEGSLLESFEQAEDDFANENYFRILKSILEIRDQMYNIDVRLQDCHTILADYQKLLLAGRQEQEESEGTEQLSLDFEGKDVTIDEEGNVNLEVNEDE